MVDTTSSSEQNVFSNKPARFAVGIDVGKESLDVALLTSDRLHAKSFKNGKSGFTALARWLDRLTQTVSSETHICMEASGGYEEEAAMALHDRGYRISVVNPRKTKAYADSRLQRSKTDRADAALLARYCQREQPRLWAPPAPEQRELRDLTRALGALKRERDRTRNRRSRASNKAVEKAMDHVLKVLTEQIEALEQTIEQHLSEHPELAEQRDLLVSIPGIGDTTAAVILAELGDVSRFPSARQAAAYVGLTPAFHRSGTSIERRPRLSKIGNSRLRCALYFPAVTAMRWNVIVKPFAHRLLQRGKSKTAVIGAVMRKLIHISYGVLINRKPFNPAIHSTT